MRHWLMRGLGIVGCLLAAAASEAASITYQYSGTIAGVNPALSPQFSVGQTFSGSFTYDDTGADLAPGTVNIYLFDAPTHSVQVGAYGLSGGGGVSFQDAGPDLVNATVVNPVGAPVNGLTPTVFAVLLRGTNLFNATDPVTVPLRIPSLGDFTTAGFVINFGDVPNVATVSGTLTSLQVAQPAAVPEPTSMLLIGSGLVGLVARRRSQRQ